MQQAAEVDLDRLVDYKTEYCSVIKKHKITGDNLTGLCPFHDDRANSFSVDLKTGMWHCFAEDEGGNFVTFYAKLNGLDNCRFIAGDVLKVLDDLTEKPDVIVNFAAESHVDRSITQPDLFLKTNVLGTGVLLDACRRHGVTRYHQVSTDEVYGDLPLDRPDLFFTEETPIHTSSPYSASKAGADLLVLAYARTYGLPVTVSRCSNNYGPYHFPEKLIPLMITRALADQSLPVYGEGINVRDWLYVEDHCAAIDLILRRGTAGEVYNIGGHNERTNLQVVQAVLAALGKPESLITFVTDRPGHDRRYAIDPTKIHRELGWQPETDFDTGLRRTVEWYLTHRDWWGHILSGEYQNYFQAMYRERLGE